MTQITSSLRLSFGELTVPFLSAQATTGDVAATSISEELPSTPLQCNSAPYVDLLQVRQDSPATPPIEARP